ncbi:NYN domain-containing protein [Aspergillus saccharolyticus JOP 1030-1]|uniref:NYN domain-containing protein n=1 Tax=Aspergillus saccharolyticus JOP 1030-1 TaxID=1450539 RepID=A0A318ZH75_9EURO|nr:hypothetical protein BP01DRAFT_355233 [Aspergillus saccharolyticus JOP 1030-1]PYH46829.1 hypothetical protein BP01DRAFT_355233 [Aspergillus saccharolyticus JOP 1030-1]
MPSSVESTSNWDFTAVLNLLRTPTYGSGSPVAPYRHRDPPPASQASRAVTQDESTSSSIQPSQLSLSSLPKLGDFGPLWNHLGVSGNLSSGADIELEDAQGLSPASSPPTTKIEILQRPSSKNVTLATTDQELARTSPKPIRSSGRASKAQAQAIAETCKANHNDASTKATHDLSSSESTACADSDGSLSVFDPPLSIKKSILSLVPSQVGAASALVDPYETPPSSYDESVESLTSRVVKCHSNPDPLRIQPISYKSTTERRIGLLTKLLKNFPDYANIVAQANRPAISKRDKTSIPPIHVFVDMSNIMVGYHDTVKLSRNIPVKTRIRRLPLSFQNFSLILERGRPTAKRVLVGSDRFAAIREGEQLGYETNILDRVHKVKHMTARQLKFRKNHRTGPHDSGSGSETNEGPEERWVEQGVDEILHLKILESLLDTDEPSTIVLATGDAAEAEFSGGFMKMVERALRRGWTVELVSFTQVTSYAYRRKDFRAKWGSQFRIIALDDYIEELLDM